MPAQLELPLPPARLSPSLNDGPHMSQLGEHIVPHVSSVIYIDNISLVLLPWWGGQGEVHRSAHINSWHKKMHWQIGKFSCTSTNLCLSCPACVHKDDAVYFRCSLMQFHPKKKEETLWRCLKKSRECEGKVTCLQCGMQFAWLVLRGVYTMSFATQRCAALRC